MADPTFRPSPFKVEFRGGRFHVVSTGQRGARGVTGISSRSGDGAPDANLGNDGDTYLDRETGDLYEKVDGAWTGPVGSLSGPAPDWVVLTLAADHTASIDDRWSLMIAISASIVTLPSDLPAGFSFDLIRDTWDDVHFVAGAGAALFHPDDHDRPADRHSRVSLIVMRNVDGASAEWVLSGSTAALGGALDFHDPDQSAFVAAF